MKQKLQKFLMLMAILLPCIQANAHDFEVDGIYYVKTSDNTVAVSYRGSSYNGYSNEYTGEVNIPETVEYSGTTYSVTSIGHSAFNDCSGLTSVTIPMSVTSIGLEAFKGCSGLTSVTIPNSVTSIGSYAFYKCSGLKKNCYPSGLNNPFSYGTSIQYPREGARIEEGVALSDTCIYFVPLYFEGEYVIPETITTIGRYAFGYCNGMTLVTIPNSVTSINDYAFYGCPGLTSVTIPNSVTSINDYAFYGCPGLTSMTIPNSVTSIGSYAFKGCTSLDSLTFEDGDATLSLGYNGSYEGLFYDCPLKSLYLGRNLSYNSSYGYSPFAYTGLQSITIGDSVSSIGLGSFYGCPGLTSVTIPNSVTSIGSSAFSSCSGLTSVTIPNSVTSIGSSAFYGCTSLDTLTFEDGDATLSLGYNGSNKGLFYDCPLKSLYLGRNLSYTSSSSYGYSPFAYTGLQSITIGDSVTSIGSFAFYNCSGLTSVTIPNSVTSIGSSAFSSCPGLTSVTIPNSVTSIGSSAFSSCSSLTSVTIPNSVTSIGSSAFSGCGALEKSCYPSGLGNPFPYGTSIQYPREGARIEDGIVLSDTGIYFVPMDVEGEFVVTEAITTIGNSAFRDCSGLISVTIPNSVTSIGNDAFYGCSGLTSVTIPNSVTSIGSEAFYNCSSLTSVTIPNSVTSIGSEAFYNCSGLTSVNFNAENCTSAGSYDSPCFPSSITEFKIGNHVKAIPSYLLYCCSGLTSVTIPNSVTSIGSSAFYGCTSLDSLTFEDGDATLSLGYNGSYEGLFYDCPLKSLYLGRNLSYTSTPDSGYSPFANKRNLQSLTIGDSVTSIGSYAFYNCSGLTSVTIPNSVTSIGSSAFSSCSGLTSVTIPNSVTSIGSSAFSSCSSLTSVTIPNSVTSIGSSAFSSCSGLTSVTIPSSVTSIGSSAFSSCPGLTSVTIPNSVTSVGNSTFNGCTSLDSLTFEDGDATLSLGYNGSNKGLFYDCPLKSLYLGRNLSYTSSSSYGYSPFAYTGLQSITIGDSVTSIGSYAFYDCSDLTSVTIPNSVTSIGNYAFDGCNNLHSLKLGSGLLSIGSWSPFSSNVHYPEKVVWLANTPPSGYNNIKAKVNFVANNNYSFSSGTSYVYNNLNSMFETDGIVYVPVNPAERTCDIIDCSYSDAAKDIALNPTTSYRGIQMSVKNIRPYSFYGNKHIENLTVELEASIPQYAFYGCNNIKGIKLPASITSVGDYAFYGCSSATEIALENAGSIGDYAFSGSATGEEAVLSISPTVTSVGANAFNGCSSIKTAEIRNAGNIGDYTFSGCHTLEEINIQNFGIIGQYAFQNCSAAESLTIAQTVTAVGNYAFSGCSSIADVTIEDYHSDDVSEESRMQVFDDWTSTNHTDNSSSSHQWEINVEPGDVLSFVYWTDSESGYDKLSVTVDGSALDALSGTGQSKTYTRTFDDVKTVVVKATYTKDDSQSSGSDYAGIRNIGLNMPEVITGTLKVLSLGSNGSSPLFSDCPLDEVYIGRELSYQTGSSYGYSPFYRNTSLRSIEITDTETKIYDNEFYGCTNLQNVKIGDGVKSFGKYAFSGCSKIESFEFGRSVETIGEEAFSDCEGMTSMTSHNPVPPVCGTEALDDINKWECTLHVPTDALEAYMAADQWRNFFFINDDVSTEKYFDYEGLCFRVTDFDNLACEVVAPQDAPASVRMRAAAARERETVASVAIPATAGYGGNSYAVKGIADSAFSTFGQLEEVVIPEGVEYVGHNAFAGCSELHAVTVEALTPPTAYVDSFDSDTYSNAVLSFPEESKMLYRAADCWKEFMNFTMHVRSAAVEGLTEIGRYSTNGQSVAPTYRGVVIIKYSDGSVRKMIAR